MKPPLHTLFKHETSSKQLIFDTRGAIRVPLEYSELLGFIDFLLKKKEELEEAIFTYTER